MLVANYHKMLGGGGGGGVLPEYVKVYSLNAECTVLTPIFSLNVEF